MRVRNFLFLVFLCAFESLFAQMGSWKTFFSYNHVDQIVQSSDKVYALSNNALFSVDKEYESIDTYTKVNGLTDGSIHCIAYGEDQDALIIVYENSNIDLLKGNSVANISDLKRKEISNKEVNSITIYGNYAYLACGFGIVVVDLKKEEIADTYIIGESGGYISISSIKIVKDSIYALSTNKILCASVKDKNLADYARWNSVDLPFVSSGDKIVEIGSFSDCLTVVVGSTLYVNRSGEWSVLKEGDSFNLMLENDVMLVDMNDSVFVYDKTFQVIDTLQLGTITDILYSSSDKSYWVSVLRSDGLSILQKYKDGVEQNSYLPDGPFTSIVAFVKYQQGKLITGSGGPFDLPGYDIPGYVQIYENGKWSTISEGSFPDGIKDAKIPFCDVLDAIIDPLDSRRMYVATWRSVFAFYDNVPTIQYRSDNSLLQGGSQILTDGLFFDKDNNLWMLNMLDKDLIKVMKSDGEWTSLYYSQLESKGTAKETFISEEGLLWVICPRATVGAGAFIADLNNTPFSVGDDKRIMYSSFIDKDGNTVSPNAFRCIAEDKNGVIWLGTSAGPLLISDQSKVFDSDFRIERVKITRADDANYADYLLANEQVNAIVVDGGNRKWVATATSGVYLLSEDGTETIFHFTTDNSPLTSNAIMDLALNEETGELFIATATAMFSYMTDATEGSESYSEVYAYPNPVPHTFDGDIAVCGLLANSQVRIADVEGNLIYQGYSNGGTFTWNGRDKNGRRVNSGVYFVFAALEDGSSKMVTKIAFIN